MWINKNLVHQVGDQTKVSTYSCFNKLTEIWSSNVTNCFWYQKISLGVPQRHWIQTCRKLSFFEHFIWPKFSHCLFGLKKLTWWIERKKLFATYYCLSTCASNSLYINFVEILYKNHRERTLFCMYQKQIFHNNLTQ